MTARRVRFDTVPAEARAFNGRPAGVVTRTLANVLDLAIAVLIVAGCYLAISGVWFLRRGADFRFSLVSFQTAYAAGFLTLVVYFTLCWAAGGRTYGDRVLGLRVCTLDDLDPSLARSFLRAVLCAAFPLLLVWAAVDGQGRSVQDLLVRTRVVYDWGGSRGDGGSDDPGGMAVDVAPAVTHESDDGHAEPLPRFDGER
jgi:uncharacterized RDD family membrane protein YckC